MSRQKKFIWPQFSKYRFQIESAWAHSLWAHADSIWSRYFENCGRIYFFWRLIILLTDPILSHSPNFGRPKQGQKFVVPTFHIHFLNPERVRIPWVLAPKNFPVENFPSPNSLAYSSSQRQDTPDSLPPKKAVFGRFLGKKFSWQNGRLSPIACLTDSESYWSRG